MTPPRPWLSVTDTGVAPDHPPLRVLTYNIMAEMYSPHSAYEYCTPDALRYDARKHRIVAEISLIDPDIICLQEVEATHFRDFFRPKFLNLGYESALALNQQPEGSAVFWRLDKFRHLGQRSVSFATLAEQGRLHTRLLGVVHQTCSTQLCLKRRGAIRDCAMCTMRSGTSDTTTLQWSDRICNAVWT
eukprot:TRINITY_DN1025_c0_g1_i9.p3 TRINITY_DN1025_c0_g1~~TRINITY_DN1025_c0_g1_i9.p3  ORF type:complete len:188 (-),score=29.29 TRINITY_DN1025_c0_g1_i9:799-1362(-)